MVKQKDQDWTPIKRRVEVDEYIPEQKEVLAVDKDVLDSLPRTTSLRLNKIDPDTLTLKQRQRVGAEWLAEVLTHPVMRRRIIEEGIKDPITLLKIGSQERPKELHVEQEINHNVVVVPARMDEMEWNAAVDAEVLKTEEGWSE